MWKWILEIVVFLAFVGFGGFQGFVAWAVLSALFMFGLYFQNQTQLKAAQVALQADKQQKEDRERELRMERMLGESGDAPALLPAVAGAWTAPAVRPASDRRCKGCSAALPSEATFCDECGQPVAQDCPSCGTANRDGARFCKKCRAPLQPDPVPAPAPKVEQPAAPISWECPKCGVTNARRRTRCRQCDAWNPA